MFLVVTLRLVHEAVHHRQQRLAAHNNQINHVLLVWFHVQFSIADLASKSVID